LGTISDCASVETGGEINFPSGLVLCIQRKQTPWHKISFFAPVISNPDKTAANNGKSAVGKPISEAPSQKLARRYTQAKFILGTGFILALMSLTMIAVISHQSAIQLQDASRAVEHAREVVEKLGDVSAGLSEVESSARSFAISGKQSHLNPFYTAAQAVPQQVNDLKALLRDDPARLRAVIEIEPAIAKHLKTMKSMVELGDKNLFRGFSQRGLTDEGNTLMEQIRAVFAPMEKAQRDRLNREQASAAGMVEDVARNTLAGNVLTAILILVCGICVLRVLRGRVNAEDKLDRLLGSMPDALIIINAEGKIISSNAHMEKLFGYSERELQGERMALLVPERFRQTQRQYYAGYFSQRNGRPPAATMEFCGLHKDGREFPIEVSTKPLAAEGGGLLVTSTMRDITGRKQVEEQIFKLNKELENRAMQLEAANKELEAFSYSVSHDLRSPLQNIDSFSLILKEDYANRLDASGLEYVERLRASCQHMEDIINALLSLSSMMRSELVVDQFDLSALAHAVAADLKQKEPDRLVEWVIADGLTAEGDAQLLRVVLENLFGNAWKFTMNRPRARIEFGALPQSNGARTYFVRDDGAGFDMTRVGTLFTPFKRLHSQNEFRGTGVGLATVQRVIQRHHGKIWAEGIVDHGATFCFTLREEGGSANGQLHSPASN
jgi:PAS domain S-box-containing protein